MAVQGWGLPCTSVRPLLTARASLGTLAVLVRCPGRGASPWVGVQRIPGVMDTRPALKALGRQPALGRGRRPALRSLSEAAAAGGLGAGVGSERSAEHQEEQQGQGQGQGQGRRKGAKGKKKNKNKSARRKEQEFELRWIAWLAKDVVGRCGKGWATVGGCLDEVVALQVWQEGLKARGEYSPGDHYEYHPLDGRALALLVRELGRLREVGAALGVVAWAEEEGRAEGHGPTSYMYNSLVTACGLCGEVEELQRIPERMFDHGVKQDTVTLAATASAYAGLGLLEEAECMVDRMRAKGGGVVAEPRVYSALIAAYGRRGDAKRAVGVLERMREEGCPPNTITYNAAISACSRAKQYDLALSVLAKMQGEGVRRDGATKRALQSIFHHMLGAAARRGQWKWAGELLDRMRECGVERSAFALTAACAACAKARGGGEGRRALGYFRELLANHRHDVTTRAFNLALKACEKGVAYRPPGGEEEQGQEHPGGGHPPPPPPAAWWADARELFALMDEYGCTPDAYTFSTLIAASSAAPSSREGRALLDDMLASGVEPNAVVFNSLLLVHCQHGEWEAAESLVGEMAAAGAPPTLVTYRYLIRACAGGGQRKRAWRHYQALVGPGSGLAAEVGGELQSELMDCMAPPGQQLLTMDGVAWPLKGYQVEADEG